MVIIIGRATIPDIEGLQVNGDNDVFLISGTTSDEKTKLVLRANLALIRKGQKERCSFTTNEDIPVRNEELKVSDLSISEDAGDHQSRLPEKNSSCLSFRIVLVSEDVKSDNPSELLL